MPEAGYLPIPKKLAAKGVKDMVRVSDARMSGTAFGTIVLHVTPDCRLRRPARPGAQRRPHPAFGEERRIDLLVDEAELKRRAAAAKPAATTPERGYARLYAQEILGADQGCDFAFLEAALKTRKSQGGVTLRLFKSSGAAERIEHAPPLATPCDNHQVGKAMWPENRADEIASRLVALRQKPALRFSLMPSSETDFIQYFAKDLAADLIALKSKGYEYVPPSQWRSGCDVANRNGARLGPICRIVGDATCHREYFDRSLALGQSSRAFE